MEGSGSSFSLAGEVAAERSSTVCLRDDTAVCLGLTFAGYQPCKNYLSLTLLHFRVSKQVKMHIACSMVLRSFMKMFTRSLPICDNIKQYIKNFFFLKLADSLCIGRDDVSHNV